MLVRGQRMKFCKHKYLPNRRTEDFVTHHSFQMWPSLRNVDLMFVSSHWREIWAFINGNVMNCTLKLFITY